MEQRIDILIAEAVDLLKGMIAIPSESFGEDKVCTFISEWLTARQISHKRVGNNLIARLSEQQGIEPDKFDGKPTLMLCAHIDTVSASNEYSFDPYCPDYAKASEVISARIANGELPEAPSASADESGIVAGLGSNDDGASVVSMIATFRYFISSVMSGNVETSPDLVLVLSCEVERSGINVMTGLW